MLKIRIKFTLTALLLIALQVWMFSPLYLFRYATPFVYPVVLLLLPVGTSPVALTLCGFIIGFIIDMLEGTPGLHTSTLTALAFARNVLIRPFTNDQTHADLPPIKGNLGLGKFHLLLLWYLFCHHLLMLFLDALILFDPLYLILRLGACLAVSYAVSIILFMLVGNARTQE